MKTNTQGQELLSQKIIKNLTGHYETDKKSLVDGIRKVRAQNAEVAESRALGIALYKLLLDNGLNESDVINTSRLLEKIDGFLYNNQLETAILILEVLDALQPYKKIDEDGCRVYCFNNEIEAKIFQQDGVIANPITWLESLRPFLLAQKAKIYLENNKQKDALAAVKELLEINPVSFTGHVLLAQLSKEKTPKKFKQILLSAVKYAYSPAHFVQLFANLYSYYVAKEDLVTAYAVLSAIKIYENADELLDELDKVKQKMGRTVVTPFKVPTAEQILLILQREEIPVQITDQNYDILISLYEQYFHTQNKQKMREIAPFIQGFAGQEDIIKIIEKRLKK